MAAAFKIETGIAIPERLGSRGASPKYPWATMDVGQSFFVPNPPKHFASMVTHAGRLHSRSFSYRTMDDGIRVWRTA
jgi:hypothetical protein